MPLDRSFSAMLTVVSLPNAQSPLRSTCGERSRTDYQQRPKTTKTLLDDNQPVSPTLRDSAGVPCQFTARTRQSCALAADEMLRPTTSTAIELAPEDNGAGRHDACTALLRLLCKIPCCPLWRDSLMCPTCDLYVASCPLLANTGLHSMQNIKIKIRTVRATLLISPSFFSAGIVT